MKCPFCEASLAADAQSFQYAVLLPCTECKNPLTISLGSMEPTVKPLPGQPDIRLTARPGSIGHDLLKALPESIQRLPMLPAVAHEVLRMLNDPDVTMASLSSVIERDPVIAIKILQVANSALYGGLTDIKDLAAACARLGLRNVATTVQVAASGRLYVTKDPKFSSMMAAFRTHSLVTACCARELAHLLALPSSEILFVMGLLHDIGKVLILDLVANQIPSGFSDNATHILRQAPELLDEVLSSYHCLIGLHILNSWKLPPEFGVSAFCQENVDCTPDDHWLPFVHVVALASVIADLSFSEESEDVPSLLGHASTKYLGLNDMKIAILRADIEDQVQAFLDIA